MRCCDSARAWLWCVPLAGPPTAPQAVSASPAATAPIIRFVRILIAVILRFQQPPIGRTEPAEPTAVAVLLPSGCGPAEPAATAASSAPDQQTKARRN